MKRIAKVVITIIEFILAFLFVQGGVKAILLDELPTPDNVLDVFVNQWAVYGYGVLWIAAGIGLIVSRYAKWVRIHGASLMVMYLSCVYVAVLETALSGWSWSDQWLTLVVGAASAWLYLRWKYVTKPVRLEVESERF